MRRPFLILLVLATASLFASTSQAAELTLFDGAAAPTIIYDDAKAAPLGKAAELLARDLTALTGKTPVVARKVSAGTSAGQGPVVIIGLAKAPGVAALLKANHIDAAPLAGQWETYGRAQVVLPGGRTALVIFGSDVRGAIWGVMDLSREMGVSPWEWWADVKIREVGHVAVSGDLRYSKTPSVKYRGIFLNDEEFGLYPWASQTNDPQLHDVGPKTYARVYELMWRLKANTFWPAMRGVEKSFNQIPGNAEMAQSYGLVRASSHAEMISRTNIREWDVDTMGPYNVFENRKGVLNYWREAVRRWGKNDNMYTVGMRGIEDRPMQGANTPQDQARALETVFAEQRKMLGEELKKPIDQVPQVFTPYKEVLPAYDSGLKVPDDVTLNWPDDNYGYIRRLSNAKERARSGGSGIYYHISYWGYPMSYLWLANTHPALMWEEMNKAYQFGAKRLWIVNVGDIKPGEYLSQLFLDMAFDNDAYPDVASVKAHLGRWAGENFGVENGGKIADILWRQYDLAFARNPEFMGWTTTKPVSPVKETEFNIASFGDENGRRRAAYDDLAKQSAALEAAMPADRKDAFYELVKYPVDMAAAVNQRQLDLDKSIAYAFQHRASANAYGQSVHAAQEKIEAGGRAYNETIAGGKWRGMMGMAPHGLPFYKAPAAPSWTGGEEQGCAAQAEGGAFYDAQNAIPGESDFMRKLPHLLRYGAPELPAFHAELGGSRYVDLFVKSTATTARWTASPDQPWITVSQASGTLSTTSGVEQRLEISIDWSLAPKGAGRGTVNLQCGEAPLPIPVAVILAAPMATPEVSFIEADRIVSMYAAHADQVGSGWAVLDGLGHTGASLRSDIHMTSVDAQDAAAVAAAPKATWRFATVTTDDPGTLRVIALPILPVTSENRMRVAVRVDDGPLQVLDFTAPEFSGRWLERVQSNAAVETVQNLKLKPGPHVVTIHALDPGFTLDRLELVFAGAARAYGPVPETRVKRPAVQHIADARKVEN